MKDKTMRHDNTAGHHVHHHHPEEQSDRSGEHHGRGGHGRGGHGRGGEHGGGFGGPRGRARRGEARYILLDALRDGPKHGYEIIKALEERSGGRYAPSPGTVYPTMQYLEDMGLARADQGTERRVYHLTDAGRVDLETHTQDIADFWARFEDAAVSPASQAEIGYLREDLDDLTRTVWDGVRGPLSAGSVETIRQIRSALTSCRSQVREIVAAGIPAAAEI